MAFRRFPKGFKSPRETHQSPTKHFFFFNLRPGKTHIGPRNNSKQLLDGAAILIFFPFARKSRFEGFTKNHQMAEKSEDKYTIDQDTSASITITFDFDVLVF